MLFVCPRINQLDPADPAFDGGGHTVANQPGLCHDDCGAQLEPASQPWQNFYHLEPLEVTDENRDQP